MKNRNEVKSQNRKNYNQKGEKNQGQFNINQIPQTIEERELNDSVLQTKKNGYKI
ncbi:hypothetical protein BD780_002170 [Clostridium tetanomorphum]|uniref:Uncharacterized protein n=1 Tax=Clostridium tetanomorphum TaxID=1553 RepID=A0A923E8A2_CLOTT|nr:hypothetical protein [Clostridium tetanomorphum]KAJ49475.1 hypothetical protein CTM_22766 [Clostridium tetanomorphum DSM 665]KAJ51448.1 hypothetical protein CTM_12690 [Clostridium tetanomorphum DSM 665]MBC2396541.1 hypothetical protein [Clostridium tetanomorphum]MBP1863867.1 hypothetical protein [Clostridium tetanomorphum]NRS84945.1 hypothetical protein [Clostridium tetanomorphum]